MPRAGASDDPMWIENELEMLERTFNMYKVYASNANTKDEKTAWDKRLKGMEERIEEAKKKLDKARQRLGIKTSS